MMRWFKVLLNHEQSSDSPSYLLVTKTAIIHSVLAKCLANSASSNTVLWSWHLIWGFPWLSKPQTPTACWLRSHSYWGGGEGGEGWPGAHLKADFRIHHCAVGLLPVLWFVNLRHIKISGGLLKKGQMPSRIIQTNCIRIFGGGAPSSICYKSFLSHCNMQPESRAIASNE